MKKISKTESLKDRMWRVKKKIRTPYVSVYEHLFGKQSKDSRDKIRQVFNLRVVDEKIIKNFEIIAKTAK